jgi:hypothetical protein
MIVVRAPQCTTARFAVPGVRPELALRSRAAADPKLTIRRDWRAAFAHPGAAPAFVDELARTSAVGSYWENISLGGLR